MVDGADFLIAKHDETTEQQCKLELFRCVISHMDIQTNLHGVPLNGCIVRLVRCIALGCADLRLVAGLQTS